MSKNFDEYVNELNPEQKEAALHTNGSVMVLAAAGSGKTKTLTTNVSNLILNKGVFPHNILVVTFTNKAAKELKNRLENMGVKTDKLWVGTFHGVCNRIIRNHAEQAGLRKNFYIMDQQEQLSFLKRIGRAHDFDPKVYNMSDLQDKINGYKEVGWRSNKLRAGSIEHSVYSLYEQECIKENCVDFAELMLCCMDLFHNYPEIAAGYADKFRHILVDEFQDTNEMQYSWLRILAAKYKNIFAVGDDDQCLVEGTDVSTPNGAVKIEKIKIGDLVYSMFGTKKVLRLVTRVFKNKHTTLKKKITLESGESVISTPEHGWYVTYSQPGESFVIIDDSNPKDVCVEMFNKENKEKPYSIKLSKDVELSKKYLEILGFKENKDAFIMEFDSFEKALDIKNNLFNLRLDWNIFYNAHFERTMGLAKAKEIHVGAFMRLENGIFKRVSKIEDIKIDSYVYDIDVEETHNFFANGILSHNSIYSFRGAKPENINIFMKEFNAKLIKIEKNYRSDAHVLEAANAVISNNSNRQGKMLVPTKSRKNKLRIYESFNDEQEAQFIAGEIKKLRRSGVHYKNIAILYRSNSQSRSLEKAIAYQNIPYIIYGGFRFFDRQEVKHAMAYLRLALDETDNMAFLRVANFPARAIGESALKKLDKAAKENNVSLYEMVSLSDDKTKKKFEPFIAVIDKLNALCEGKNLFEQVKTVIVESGLERLYEADKKEGPERLDNLYELLSAAEVFMYENTPANVQDFLAFSTLESNVETKEKNDNADVIKMMTVHASKGLEFDYVFVTGMEEGMFPHANSLKDKVAIEEERRLMYVAITRAKTTLYLTQCEERLVHGQRNHFVKSRFLNEIPTDLIMKA